jgi:hypothetical protein
MNIRWNAAESRFEAEFSSDFTGDLEAVKIAKFHTDGPPSWVWYAPPPGIAALNRLRLNRPASGLTITPEALAVFEPLAQQEIKNAEIRKQLAEQRKQAKKKQSPKSNWLLPGKEYLGAEDLPAAPPFVPLYTVSKIAPVGACRVCKDPTFGWPDLIDLCLYCEKQIGEESA